MTDQLDDNEVRNCIRETFVKYISPDNIIWLFHKYDTKVLTENDIQQVKAKTFAHGPMEGAQLLLNRLPLYKNWFPCLMKVLRDEQVKLEHVAETLQYKLNANAERERIRKQEEENTRRMAEEMRRQREEFEARMQQDRLQEEERRRIEREQQKERQWAEEKRQRQEEETERKLQAEMEEERRKRQKQCAELEKRYKDAYIENNKKVVDTVTYPFRKLRQLDFI